MPEASPWFLVALGDTLRAQASEGERKTGKRLHFCGERRPPATHQEGSRQGLQKRPVKKPKKKQVTRKAEKRGPSEPLLRQVKDRVLPVFSSRSPTIQDIAAAVAFHLANFQSVRYALHPNNEGHPAGVHLQLELLFAMVEVLAEGREKKKLIESTGRVLDRRLDVMFEQLLRRLGPGAWRPNIDRYRP